MEKLHFTVEIEAPRHTIWTAMLDDASYRQWTGVFYEGSYYEGSWEQGSEIRFLGPSEDGEPDGMVATVAENRPDEFMSLEYSGQILHGKVDTESDEGKRLVGAREEYRFSWDAAKGVTTLTIDVDATEEEYVAVFTEGWPKALAKLKEIAEARVREPA